MKSTVSLNQPSRASLSDRLSSWLESDNGLLSYIMDESVSNRQMLLFSQAMTSGLLLLCSTFMCIEALVLFVAWFGYSLNLCKKGGMR